MQVFYILQDLTVNKTFRRDQRLCHSQSHSLFQLSSLLYFKCLENLLWIYFSIEESFRKESVNVIQKFW